MVFFIYPSNEDVLFVFCELCFLNFKIIVFIYVPNKRTYNIWYNSDFTSTSFGVTVSLGGSTCPGVDP